MGKTTMAGLDFDLVWWWRVKLPERKGEPCRVLARGKMNSVLVEFRDGFKVITSRYAVRRAPPRGDGG